jgi:hypothetical protein
MELEISYPCSQEPATGPHPEQVESSPQPPITFLYDARSSCGLFPSEFPNKTLYTSLFPPICATCPANLPSLHAHIHNIYAKVFSSWIKYWSHDFDRSTHFQHPNYETNVDMPSGCIYVWTCTLLAPEQLDGFYPYWISKDYRALYPRRYDSPTLVCQCSSQIFGLTLIFEGFEG